MDMTQQIKQICEAVHQEEPEFLISEFKFKKNAENELLFFFKPECFLDGNPSEIKFLIEMVFEKFDEFNVEVSGILLFRGKRLEELSIMDRHYGFINTLSRKASQILSEEELLKIQQSLGIDKLSNYKVLGGHECLNEFSGFNEKSLNEFWQTKESIKLRSGFYIQEYLIEGQQRVLVNGFHPSQLRHFTNPEHLIIVMLLHSDTDWKILKNDFAGDTFPEKAKEDSIRGEIFRNRQKYGIKKVAISSNCVHLSAGPFEALFEIDNFLKSIETVGLKLERTNMACRMADSGLTQEDFLRCLLNPTASIDDKTIDIFTYTEEKNSTEAIFNYREYFLG